MPKQPAFFRLNRSPTGRYKTPKKAEVTSRRYREACDIRSSSRWKKLQRLKIATDPICEDCNQRPATQVHHITPLSENIGLAFDWDNLESVCGRCHAKKRRKG